MRAPFSEIRRRSFGIVLLGTIALAAPTASALGAAGSIDSAFSPGGWAPSGSIAQVNTVVAQPDGRLITADSATGSAGVRRSTADGVVDISWTPAITNGSSVQALAVQPDGRVLIGGQFSAVNGTPRSGIARLNTDGTLDPTYDPGLDAGAIVRAIAVQSDGKAIVSGVFSAVLATPRNGLARLNSDGTLDTAFATAGATGPRQTGALVGAHAISVQADGSIILGGDFDAVNGTAANGITRLAPDGTVDGTFNPSVAGGANVHALARDTSGRLLIGGTFATVGGRATANIARLTAAGIADTSWAVGGPNGPVEAIGIAPDGKVIVGGSFTQVDSTAASRLARLGADGTLDTSFAAAAGVNNPVLGLLVQPTAKAVIGGAFNAPTEKLARVDGGAAVPGVPTGITAAAGDRSATVTWTPPASTGGIPITGYTVTGIPGGSCTTAGTSCTITGLANGTGYTFQVHATNALGSGADSGPSAPVIPSGGPSGAGGGSGAGGSTPSSPIAALRASWRVKGRVAVAIITPGPFAGYSLKATRKGAAARTGTCRSTKAKGKVVGVVCRVQLAKGAWTLTADARAGGTVVARSTRKVSIS